ncbi:hypothetical protein J2X31_003608 [Flavobacterium arsenatis]|uniref:Uncharacterized protein n=1 Tax=Flavobacterium arsenatis TaxID=1484332 RepID=A0ABU1TUL6_9FLAO|nr:hypothetical protein [Flavobacterium arsenatis]
MYVLSGEAEVQNSTINNNKTWNNNLTPHLKLVKN